MMFPLKTFSILLFTFENVTTRYMYMFYLLVGFSQGQRKEFRVGPAKIVWSTKGASTLEGSGGVFPWEIFNFSFSKILICHILGENLGNSYNWFSNVSCNPHINNFQIECLSHMCRLNADVTIFLLKDVSFLLYTLLILERSQYFYKLKKSATKFKSWSGHDGTNQTGSAGHVSTLY